MTSINWTAVRNMEENIKALLGDDVALKRAATAYLKWRETEREEVKNREIRKGTYVRSLIPGAEALFSLSDKSDLLKILQKDSEQLLIFLKKPNASASKKPRKLKKLSEKSPRPKKSRKPTRRKL